MTKPSLLENRLKAHLLVMAICFGFSLGFSGCQDNRREADIKQIEEAYYNLRRELAAISSTNLPHLFVPGFQQKRTSADIAKQFSYLTGPDYVLNSNRVIRITGEGAELYPRDSVRPWSGATLYLRKVNNN